MTRKVFFCAVDFFSDVRGVTGPHQQQEPAESGAVQDSKPTFPSRRCEE